jgi:hypothetical protein
MNRKECADKCFDDIMQLQGVDELKSKVRYLQKYQQNKEKYSISDVTLPNYLWFAKRGGGITTCLNAFSEYLYAARVIEFTGIVKYFEFIPAYTEPDAYFSELVRLNNTITEIAGHNRYFKGIACIIIDEWLDSINDVNFNKMLDYIDNKNEKILAIFCAHTDNKRTIANIETAITAYMRTETITLRFPNTDELLGYIEDKYIKKHNFYLAEDAKLLLTESINEIITSKYFNGFKTIKQLANDIIYSLLVSNLNSCEIKADALCNFSKDMGYIKRIKTSGGKNKLGFGLKEEC